MKVLIYTHAFAPKVGGAETLVMLLAEGLAERLGQRNTESVTVTTPTPVGGFDDKALPFRVVRRPSLLQLMRLMREASVVHVAGPCFVPMVLGLLLRKRVVIEHHGFQPICPNGLLFYKPTQTPCPGHFMAGRHYECLRCNSKQGVLQSVKMWALTFPRRWLCNLASQNVSITEWLAKALALARTEVIYCGTRTEGVNGTIAELKQPLTLAFMGRLVPTKGVHILLEAAQGLKAKGLPFRIKVIGEGPERRILEARANDLGLADSVEFMGYVPEEALETTLKDVPVVVMPSLNGETFGLVAAENMMAGRLMVVSDIGVLSEVVGDAGLKFPAGDAEGLQKCLLEIVENPGLAEKLRLMARERALRLFSQERMVEGHLSLYGGVLCGD